MTDENLFLFIRDILNARQGKDNAITIGDLANAAGVSRREVEQVIELNLDEFPFPIVSGSAGLFIPVEADDVNRYLGQLESRLGAIGRRRKTVMAKAREFGLQFDGSAFVDNPVQADLLGILDQMKN